LVSDVRGVPVWLRQSADPEATVPWVAADAPGCPVVPWPAPAAPPTQASVPRGRAEPETSEPFAPAEDAPAGGVVPRCEVPAPWPGCVFDVEPWFMVDPLLVVAPWLVVELGLVDDVEDVCAIAGRARVRAARPPASVVSRIGELLVFMQGSNTRTGAKCPAPNKCASAPKQASYRGVVG
jgi:hypothetical protein